MAEHKVVLLVDDDDDLRAELADRLRATGRFTVWEAASEAGALALIDGRESRIDAYILDVALPDGDGRELCSRLRRQNIHVPMLILSGQGGESDVVRGLDAGANDYIVKPFRIAELTARLDAHLRGFETSEDVAFRIGPYLFRPAQRSLQLAGVKRPIRLTDKEAAMLKFLYRAEGEVVPRNVLLQKVWGYNEGVDSHTVETHIYRLRRKIEPDPRHIALVISEGGGYRLCLNAEAEPQPTVTRRPNGFLAENLLCA